MVYTFGNKPGEGTFEVYDTSESPVAVLNVLRSNGWSPAFGRDDHHIDIAVLEEHVAPTAARLRELLPEISRDDDVAHDDEDEGFVAN
jgi:hypothetical protein